MFPSKISISFGSCPYVPEFEQSIFIERKEKKQLRVRERIDLVDVSQSMRFEFQNTGKSYAQMAREAHMKFLKMRAGCNDRVSLWIFSSNPYKIEDFTVDEDIYRMQLDDAPYIIGLYSPEEGIPKDKVQYIQQEGTTDLKKALQSVICYFKEEGIQTDRKALLLITDAAVDGFPHEELLHLKKEG